MSQVDSVDRRNWRIYDHTATFDHNESVGSRQHALDVMAHHHDRGAGHRLLSNGVGQVMASFQIQSRIGLIEKEHGCTLRPHARQVHSLSLTAREFCDHTSG